MTAPGWQAREALATRLKALRNGTGLDQAPFAERLGGSWDQTKVSRVEAVAEKKKSRAQLPSLADVETWATATGADVSELQELRNRAEAERSLMASFEDQFSKEGGAGRHQDDILLAEQASKRLAFYYPLILPGVLQTADWAREMLALDGGPASYGAPEDDIRSMIASRVRRGAILSEPGRQIIVVTTEAALRFRAASPETMRDQCEHIARLAASPATTAAIGVVPFSAQLPFAALHGWEILDDLVLIETETDQIPVADPEQVRRFWHYTRALLSVAATGSDAAALCLRIAAEYGSTEDGKRDRRD